MTRIMGVFCKIDHSATVTLEVLNAGQDVTVKHRGSVRTRPGDDEGERRGALIEKISAACDEVDPDYVFVNGVEPDQSVSISNAFLSGLITGVLKGRFGRFGSYVTSIRPNVWTSALGCSLTHPQDPALRIFGHRAGRNIEEDTAAALAIYGFRKGVHNILKARTDAAMKEAS